MSKQVNIELLQQYLAGEIAEDAVLHDDGSPVSKEELENAVKEFEEIVLDLEGAALKSHLQGLHQTLDLNESSNSSRRWLAIAASIILIGVFGGLIWQNNNKDPELSDYFDHFDQLVTFRGADSVSYSVGLEAYSERNYDLAFDLFDKIPDLSNELKFYQGISAVGSEKFGQAISLFETLHTVSSGKYYQQVRWYLGLAYWQEGRIAQATQILDKIEVGEFKYEPSRQLIKSIRP